MQKATRTDLIERGKGVDCVASTLRTVYDFTFNVDDLMRLARQQVAAQFGVPPLHVEVRALDDGFVFTLDTVKVVQKTPGSGA